MLGLGEKRAVGWDDCADWQVRRGTGELPNQAAGLGKLERALVNQLDGKVMPAINEVDKVCHCSDYVSDS